MASHGPFRPLTTRQKQIAEGIARGLTYAEIGRELGISPHTVAAMVRTIAAMFDVTGDLGPVLAPRQIIWAWKMFERWQAEHAEALRRPA